MPRPNRIPKVKICGLTRFEDAAAAVEAGADLLGFIFYEKSPRYIDPEQARAIIAELHRVYPVDPEKPRYRTVGVFVNRSAPYIAAIMALTELDWAQLSGDEPVAVLEGLKKRAYKAIRPRTYEEADAEASFYAALSPRFGPRLLIDAYRPGEYGGTGQRADWELAAKLAQLRSILLAGGLNPDNVAEAVRTVRPWGVDVSSGVETAPGVKHHEAIRAFVRHAKRAV
ncbi:MAG TPA: phosphoribosylanthranilate isomerase [Anaerolineae bacterium]|nr:phosphoribosylanthranilate isomerase [Anaerolineae bacterium]